MTKECDRLKDVVPSKRSLSSNAVAGAIAGFTSSVVTHPLDVVKTRFQVHDGRTCTVPKYRNTVHAMISMNKTEGFRTLYSGFTPNLVGSAVAWGSYFYVYNCLRNMARRDPSLSNSRGELGMLVNGGCGLLAGVGTCFFTNPIWLIKTRLQLQHEVPPALRASMTGTLLKVVREEGVLGLYRGLLPSLALTVHGGIQFSVYEEMKKAVTTHINGGKEHLTGAQAFTIGAASKIITSLLTYPFQVMRARLQQGGPPRPAIANATAAPAAVASAFAAAAAPPQERYFHGVGDVISRTWRHEGFFGFYKGLSPSLMRVVPSSAITLVVYEKVAQYLGAAT